MQCWKMRRRPVKETILRNQFSMRRKKKKTCKIVRHKASNVVYCNEEYDTEGNLYFSSTLFLAYSYLKVWPSKVMVCTSL